MTSIQERLKPDTTVKFNYGGSQEHNPRFILGYWSIRGLGAPLRMMLNAAQVNHWVVLYDAIEAEGERWDMDSYLSDKQWLKEEYNPLMNLPFLVDCKYSRVLAQTNAIFTYLGRELKLMGKDKHEESKCEELLCEIMDLRNLMVDFAYETDVSTIKHDAEMLVKEATKHLNKLEMHLEREYPDILKNQTMPQESTMATETAKAGVCHLVGNQFSAPDFHLWEMLDQFEGLCRTYDLAPLWSEPGTKGPHQGLRPHLLEFKRNFKALPENQNYISTPPSFLASLPYNNPYARFGSDPRTLGQFSRGQEAPWRKKGVIEIACPEDK